ncbi:glycosyltransferase family 2 protein [Gordonia sp. NPDC003376]
MTAPAISLVCSTIGRPDAFGRLLQSIADSDIVDSDIADGVELILVDQDPDRRCTEVLDTHTFRGTAIATTSGRGASTGRNAGTILATGDLLAFPDDNCWYPPETLRRVVRRLRSTPAIDGLSGIQVTVDGSPSMLRWQSHATTVSRSNILRTSVCSTMFLRRSALPSQAPFDEGIGVGSPGLRGAGEESDLLLRMIAAGSTIAYDPTVRVFQADDRHDISEAFIDKMYKYGIGTGHLWRRHRLSRTQLLYYAGRKAGASVVRRARGDRILADSDIAYLRGEFIGYLGRDRQS